MRADPAFAAEYRRLEALRDAVRRHAPREAAPQGARRPCRGARCADADAETPSRPRRRPVSRRGGPARARDRRLVRRTRLRRRRRTLWRCGRRAPPSDCRRPRLRLRPRRDRRTAVRRRLVRPAHREALARRPHHGQRGHRRPCSAGLPARGRPRLGRRPRPGPDARLSPQRAHGRRDRAAARRPGGAAASGIETIDGYHVARWTDANLAYVAVSDMDEKDARRFRRGVQTGAEARGRSAREVTRSGRQFNCSVARHRRKRWGLRRVNKSTQERLERRGPPEPRPERPLRDVAFDRGGPATGRTEQLTKPCRKPHQKSPPWQRLAAGAAPQPQDCREQTFGNVTRFSYSLAAPLSARKKDHGARIAFGRKFPPNSAITD